MSEHSLENPSALLDLPPVMVALTAQQWHDSAIFLFEAVYGPSDTLTTDLRASAKFFDPVAQGQRLRKELGEIGDRARRSPVLPSSWQFDLPADRALLTPDGIAGMHALRIALHSAGKAMLDLTGTSEIALMALLRQYRTWNQHRISGVVGLLSGDDSPLQLPGIGTLLTLLVNNNVGPERALTRASNSDLDRRRVVDDAFFAAVDAFTEQLAPTSRTKSGGGQLISGWYVGEISRRLGDGMVFTRGDNTTAGSMFLRSDRVPQAIDLICRDLSRGNRKRPTVRELKHAYDALVEAFLQQKDALGSFGDLHESPTLTLRRRDEILHRYTEITAGDER